MRDSLFVNGRFWPADGASLAPGSLLARCGRIQAIGAIAPSPGMEVVDLRGRVAIPGPVDSHCHLVSYGMTGLREADLRGARSLEEIAARLRAHAAALGLRPGDGRWLLGRGFEQDRLVERRWPERRDLDAVADGADGERPVRITRVCGHALAANTAALRAAGLDPEGREPGYPEGVVTEERMARVHAAVPAPGPDEWRSAAKRACEEAARAGFVGVHSLMAHAAEIRALVDLHREGPLPVRVRMQLPFALLENAAAAGLRTGFGDESLAIGAVKLFSDGSLGARTAALRAPYADAPGTRGELIYPPEELTRRVLAIVRAGFQPCIHAIGDRAMDVTLDAIEAASREEPLSFPARIEHASMVDGTILRRMRELGVAAAIQPQFAWSDDWVPARLGADRAAGCYAFRSMARAGILLSGGTDCPVERLDAMAAIGQLVHRPAWSPDEGLPLEEALRIFSEGSYRISGHPAGTGRLAAGQHADFVVLEEDPRRVAPEEIERIPVAMTVVGGRIVFARD